MQLALIEFARHKANMPTANSTEFQREAEYPVIAMISEWLDSSGKKETRHHDSDLGGTMRLGSQVCVLDENSRSRKIYGHPTIVERHRHRYEVNNVLLPQLEAAGIQVVGRSEDGELVEMIELPDHPWFIACQFHPEFTSTPRDGHPLFSSFVLAARERKNSGELK